MPVVHVCARYETYRCVRVLSRRALCLQRGGVAGERTYSACTGPADKSFPTVTKLHQYLWCFSHSFSVFTSVPDVAKTIGTIVGFQSRAYF